MKGKKNFTALAQSAKTIKMGSVEDDDDQHSPPTGPTRGEPLIQAGIQGLHLQAMEVHTIEFRVA